MQNAPALSATFAVQIKQAGNGARHRLINPAAAQEQMCTLSTTHRRVKHRLDVMPHLDSAGSLREWANCSKSANNSLDARYLNGVVRSHYIRVIIPFTRRDPYQSHYLVFQCCVITFNGRIYADTHPTIAQ